MFYEMQSTHGVSLGYGAQRSETNYWRYFVVVILASIVLITGLITARVFAGIQNVAVDLPAPNLSAVGAPKISPAASPVDNSSELKTELEVWVAAHGDSSWAFRVVSLDGDPLDVSVNDTKSFELASIYKLFLVGPLAQKVPVESWATSLLTSRTYADCVDAMLSISDNPCGEAVVGKLGIKYIDQEVKVAGYSNTDFRRTDYFVGTARDTGFLLTKLYNGTDYNNKTKELALAALAKPKKVEAIRKSCNACSVMNKIGENNGVKHDAAIVEKDGKNYVVVIFSDGAKWNQLTDVSSLIQKYL